jgi:hypothetical protein
MTTTTAFITPDTVTQVTDDNGIAWSNILGSVGREPTGAQSAVTSKELYTISGLWQERFASKTNQLWFTNFPIPYTQVGYRATFTQDVYGNTTTGAAGNNSTYIDLGSNSAMISLFNPSTYYGNRYYTLYNPLTVTYADGSQQTITYVRCTNATSTGVAIGLESTAGHNFPITIQTSNYDPVSPSLLGVEVQFNSIRSNRVQDYLVQLVLNGALVGDNIADPTTDNLKTYGSSTNVWNSNITINDITKISFGVAISLRSNVLTPHSDLGYLDQVRMRITYG